MLAVVLALGTSVAYGVSNFLGPQLSRRHPVAAVLVIGQVAALAGAAVLVLASGDAVPPAAAVGFGALAGAGNVLGLAAFYRGAQLAPVSIVAAVGATGTGLPVLVGLARGEALGPLEAVGIVLAVAGAVLAAAGSRSGSEGAFPEELAGITWAGISAIGFGALLVFLPEAADDGTPWALLDARVVVVALLVAGVLLLGAPVAVPAREAPPLAVPGLLLLAATPLYAEAAARGRLSVVSVLASLATVVTVGLAHVVLGERLAPLQRAGVALAVAGTILLAV
ncbi:MAG: EamA family transporter [Solirubrobacterales bacterium]|nr:EamA family transporter [Solirubrobacterales bacterium]